MKYIIFMFVFMMGCGKVEHTLSGSAEVKLTASYKDCYELPEFGTKEAVKLGYSKEECIRDLIKKVSNIRIEDCKVLPKIGTKEADQLKYSEEECLKGILNGDGSNV